ncbi:hypothetical protein [Latilactobacillus sakei]|uniref:hypothetical protein n=1 Tax=Latilactobacillus sakei TaxID=1599 RepID=UPI000977E2A9|nr:hypothetical protein [Latilactobacillus sakei]
MERDLSDFRYYSRGGRRYLAAFITKDNLLDIQNKTGLIEALNEAHETFCYGLMALACVDQWLVLELDMRTNKPKRRLVESKWFFEREYKYMVRKNKELEAAE